MFCTSCGHEHDDQARFCARCGAATSGSAGTKTTPETGAPIAITATAARTASPTVSPLAYWARAFRSYAVFAGRASRAEYWYFVMFNSLALLALGALGGVLGTGGIGMAFSLAMTLPSLSAAVRRIHDTGNSGWLLLVPLYDLVLLCMPGMAGRNQYGDRLPDVA